MSKAYRIDRRSDISRRYSLESFTGGSERARSLPHSYACGRRDRGSFGLVFRHRDEGREKNWRMDRDSGRRQARRGHVICRPTEIISAVAIHTRLDSFAGTVNVIRTQDTRPTSHSELGHEPLSFQPLELQPCS